MADTKISALTAGAPALSTDEFPIARSGANRKLLISDILTYINANIVLPQTVAEVQAPTGNGTYTEGSWVKVTEDIGSITGSANTIFPVIEGGVLAGTGWCATFQNTGMAAERIVEIDWDVTADFVSRIKEPKQGNTVTAFFNTAGLTGFPFDTTTIEQCTMIDPVVCSINIAAIIYGATFGASATVTLGAGTTFRGTAGQEATVTLSDTATFIGEVGDNGGVTLIGTQALNWCTICANENVDCSTVNAAYTQTGKYIGGGVSTFQCDEAIDVDGANEINITQINATEDYSFCGIFTNMINGGALTDITSFVSNILTHDLEFYLAHSDAIDFPSGGNFYPNNGATISLTTMGSIIGLSYNPVLSGWNQNGKTFLI